MGVLATAQAALAVTLRPGESAATSQTLDVPGLPPKLDFLLLMDTTGSMGGEIENAKSGASTTFIPAVRADSPDSSFAVASFEDYPYLTYGGVAQGDQPYRRLTDLTSNVTTAQSAVNQLTARFGDDLPEAQVPALYAASSGAGLTWPEGGSTAAGLGISFRPGAAHFIALVSDAPFHNDKDGADAYSSTAPTYADALTSLASQHVRVIAADSNGAAVGADMAAIAADTGGGATMVNSNGSGLWTGNGVPGRPGILGVLQAARFPVTTTTSCDPLQVELSQDSWTDVAGDSELSHTQTVTVPPGIQGSDLPPDRKIDCQVAYTWGDVFIGTRAIEVEVAFPSAEQQPSVTPQTGVPSNLFSIDRARSSAKGTATLRVTLPGPGRLVVVATARAPKKPRASKRFTVRRVTKTVAASGAVSVKLKPSRAAMRILRRKGRLKTSARITFTPTGGTARTRTKAVTLKVRRPRR